MADFLFDIGKVLLDFDFETSLSRLLPQEHTAPHSALEKLIEKKDDFEAGRISTLDYTNWALTILESEASPDQFHRAWQEIFTPNLPMWETVRALRADGHRLILFSNTNAIHVPYIYDAYPEFSLFHGAVMSFEAGHIKPEPEIYQHAVEKYSLNPTKTLYIDDLAANIATGNDFGFISHQYHLTNHQAFQHWLSSHLSSH